MRELHSLLIGVGGLAIHKGMVVKDPKALKQAEETKKKKMNCKMPPIIQSTFPLGAFCKFISKFTLLKVLYRNEFLVEETEDRLSGY